MNNKELSSWYSRYFGPGSARGTRAGISGEVTATVDVSGDPLAAVEELEKRLALAIQDVQELRKQIITEQTPALAPSPMYYVLMGPNTTKINRFLSYIEADAEARQCGGALAFYVRTSNGTMEWHNTSYVDGEVLSHKKPSPSAPLWLHWELQEEALKTPHSNQ